MPSSPTTTLSGHATHPAITELRHVSSIQQVPHALFDELATVPDPRKPRGIRHPLPLLLAVALCATLANDHTYTQMHEWAKDHWDTSPGIPDDMFHHGPPSADTFERVLSLIDAEAFDQAVARWALGHRALQAPPKSPGRPGYLPVLRAYSIDGKESRSAKQGNGKRSHNLGIMEQSTAAVVGQVAVGRKSSEIPALKRATGPGIQH